MLLRGEPDTIWIVLKNRGRTAFTLHAQNGCGLYPVILNSDHAVVYPALENWQCASGPTTIQLDPGQSYTRVAVWTGRAEDLPDTTGNSWPPGSYFTAALLRTDEVWASSTPVGLQLLGLPGDPGVDLPALCAAPAEILGGYDPHAPGYVVQLEDSANAGLEAKRLSARYRFRVTGIWSDTFKGFAAPFGAAVAAQIQCEASVRRLTHDRRVRIQRSPSYREARVPLSDERSGRGIRSGDF